ncbi:hypothetical protein JTB14_034576, partial [Gonioctena quinquepunctata]
RESSSLVLGGRFGRSCFFQAGGCLGKRSMEHKQLRFLDQTPPDQEINNPSSESIDDNVRIRYPSPSDDLNSREIFSDDYPNYQN